MNDDDYVFIESSPTHFNFEEEKKKFDWYETADNLFGENNLSDSSFLSDFDDQETTGNRKKWSWDFKYQLIQPILIQGTTDWND